MAHLFRQPVTALGCYLRWYLRAVARLPLERRAPRRRRALFLLLFPLFLCLQALHWMFLLLDEWLFPAYRRQQIKRPLFILGVPRSGTTYVHRELGTDQTVSTPKTWEVLLAPSICQRRLLGLLGNLDRRLGKPLSRLLDGAAGRTQGEFSAVHSVELFAAEEDYLALLPLGACFIMLMAFPEERSLQALGAWRDVPAERRKQVLDFHHRLLQRHCYCQPAAQRLLSKNAAFAEWAQDLLARYPDAGFIVCVRPPEQALASQLAALQSARSVFAIDADGTQTLWQFTRLFARYYANLRTFLAVCPQPQVQLVAQPQLRRDPAGVLQQLAMQFDLQPAATANTGRLQSAPGHRYAPLAATVRQSLWIEEMASDYRDLLAGTEVCGV